MDYEKEYKEALGRARTFSQRWQGIEATDSELALQEVKEIFPELKESEDERIKRCIGMCITDATKQRFEDFNTTPKECLAWLEKQGEQKTAWNEEDERIFTLCASSVQTRYNDGLLTYDEYEQASLWLKSFKERVQAQLKQEWTGYDEKAYEIALLDIDKSPSITKNDTIDWLKSLKERMKGECISVTDEELAQAKKNAYNDALDKIEYHSGEPTFDDGWSEEDEKEVAVLEAYIRSRDWSDRHIDRALGIVDELVTKLKSLKERYTWKPSDEQMEALWNAIPHIPNSEKDIDTITELSVLYNDLKKLKEEWL